MVDLNNKGAYWSIILERLKSNLMRKEIEGANKKLKKSHKNFLYLEKRTITPPSKLFI
jgi:hypothetical protein